MVISFGGQMTLLVNLLVAACSLLLGWIACSLFYFAGSTRTAALLIRSSYIFYLTIINKGLEYLHYAHINRLEALRKNDKSYGHEEYETLKKDNDKQIQVYKDNAIAYLLHAHPDMFRGFIEFDDWRGSQRFLNNHKYPAMLFSKENENDA